MKNDENNSSPHPSKMVQKLGLTLGAMVTEPEHIDFVEQVFKRMESDDVARAWLMGMNPHLDDKSPLLEILAGNGRSVMGAVKAYEDGAFA